jgi:hypothetical protein
MGLGKVDKDSTISGSAVTLVYVWNGSTWIELRGDSDGNLKINSLEYLFHGKKTTGGYDYFAFKQQGGSRYRIMKKSATDASDVTWATGSSNFAADWAAYTTLTYGVVSNS